MNDNPNGEGTSMESDKPAPESNNAKFPPFPEPTDKDFENDVPDEERNYYKNKFPDLNAVKYMRLHCTACDRHLGSSARNITRMRAHPMLRTLVCHTCHTFYNSGEFEKGDDGSELYCRWCGQGGQVYCCSNCPHVFCAKCIKRNFGPVKIKEIENTDDWKCFKCCPESLRELRAICWAILRYCDLKIEMTYKIEDTQLKDIFQKECYQDYTDCCKSKNRRREKSDVKKKDEKKVPEKTAATAIISKMPPTIQVKKFASIHADDATKTETNAIKRPTSPKQKTILMKNTNIPIGPRVLNPIVYPSPAKKIKMMGNIMNSGVTFNDNFISTLTRIRPRSVVPPGPVINDFNGFKNQRVFSNVQNMVFNDNINLSLESLTQGLDMATVAAMSNNTQNNDVVCTPDFPLEPMCEVTEDIDDDVQCMTPNPIKLPKTNNQNPVVPRFANVPDVSNENIVQMTDNDVTINTMTGGLKFRIDPQTLSSNKMYRLPDGRVFAINANPNMPGGYSATIVAMTESAGKVTSLTSNTVPQGLTYSAKLNAVSTSNTVTQVKQNSRRETRSSLSANRNISKRKKSHRESTPRECDLNVPVEWYRHNLIDAVDALEFSLSRLHKLKKDSTTMYLRTRTLGEMKTIHKTLERILNTSSKRFLEIKDSLNKDMKKYVVRKTGGNISDNDDDDDVEILPDLENDDPIFIDENSVDSNVNEHQHPEIDLTEVASSELNDSGEKDVRISKSNQSISVKNMTIENKSKPLNNVSDTSLNDSLTFNDNVNGRENTRNPESNENTQKNPLEIDDKEINISSKEPICDELIQVPRSVTPMEEIRESNKLPSQIDSTDKFYNEDKIIDNDEKNPNSCESIPNDDEKVVNNPEEILDNVKKSLDGDKHFPDTYGNLASNDTELPGKNGKDPDNYKEVQDVEMSDEIIEKLLRDDTDNVTNLSSSDVGLKDI